jgi:predicted DNA binding CopG/RHH family protein
MARKSPQIPRLKSDTKDADWYASPEGRKQTQREFARAIAAGTLIRSDGLKIAKTAHKTLEQLMEQAKATATRAISIRIPIADLERAKRVAEETGVGYQVVLKRAIREGLKRAD